MMSWLEEEIGIPPEPKHPKAVGPAIQTAAGRETEPEGERKFKRNPKKKKENIRDGGGGLV